MLSASSSISCTKRCKSASSCRSRCPGCHSESSSEEKQNKEKQDDEEEFQEVDVFTREKGIMVKDIVCHYDYYVSSNKIQDRRSFLNSVFISKELSYAAKNGKLFLHIAERKSLEGRKSKVLSGIFVKDYEFREDRADVIMPFIQEMVAVLLSIETLIPIHNLATTVFHYAFPSRVHDHIKTLVRSRLLSEETYRGKLKLYEGKLKENDKDCKTLSLLI